MTWAPTQPGRFTGADIDRFMGRFEKRGPDECWPWTYHTNHGGHGRMWAGGRHTLASHIALELDGRPREEAACALHSCDNPACVNPKHLRWGTQLENIEDRVVRERNGVALGATNGSAKLTSADVLKIRSDVRPSRAIAADYGVSQVTVCNIKSGRTWGHVEQLDAQAGGKTSLSAVLPHAEEKT